MNEYESHDHCGKHSTTKASDIGWAKRGQLAASWLDSSEQSGEIPALLRTRFWSLQAKAFDARGLTYTITSISPDRLDNDGNGVGDLCESIGC